MSPPTTTAPSRSPTSATSTAPPPTTIRRSSSIRNPRWPISTAACSGRRKKDYDRAIADFDQAIRLAPDNAAAVNARGARARRQGRIRPRASPISTAPSRSSRTTPTITTTAATSGATAAASTAPSRTTTRRSRWRRTLPSPSTTARRRIIWPAGLPRRWPTPPRPPRSTRTRQALSLRGLIQEKLGARDAAIADLRRAAALDPNLSQAVDALRRIGVTR